MSKLLREHVNGAVSLRVRDYAPNKGGRNVAVLLDALDFNAGYRIPASALALGGGLFATHVPAQVRGCKVAQLTLSVPSSLLRMC